MTTTTILAHHRLSNQLIAWPTFTRPSEVVEWMGFIQAQDYLGALWAIGLRMRSAVEAQVEQALADRSIVRTWLARGTLHFVSAGDIRWMLELLAPGVISRSARRFQQLDLDEATFDRSRKLFIKALQGNHQLSRDAMFQVLESARISTAGQRGVYILSRLAQEGLICFGVREGRQQRFALLEEWVSQAKSMKRDHALAELARRYFTSHGPAKLQDFVWWSGLTASDARAGIEIAKPELEREVIDGQTYWQNAPVPAPSDASPVAHLLPAFDEYLVGYKDRSAILDPLLVKKTNAGGGMLNPTIVIDGQVMGTWKRTLKKDLVIIVPDWFTEPTKSTNDAFILAAHQYGAFLKLPVLLA